MKLLLDSHTFKWWRDEPNKISPAAFAEISNPANGVFLSVVTVWELQIKITLNKFTVKGGLENAVEDERQKKRFSNLARQSFTRFISGKSPASSQRPV